MPLPGMPVPPPRRPGSPPAGTRLVRIHARRLCQLCCELIHVVGQAKAPYPRPARWKYVTPISIRYLCERHKEDLLDEMDT